MKSALMHAILAVFVGAGVACGEGAGAVTYSYPHPPDEPGWDGAFRDSGRTKLFDGVAGGGARHSVIWAATTDERFVDMAKWSCHCR